MAKRGRPPIPEAAMFIVWRMVEEEMHRAGHRIVRRACTSILKRCDGLIKFIAPSAEPGKPYRITDDIHCADRMRKRYAEAEIARHDPTTYPILHHRAAHLLATLPETVAREKAMAATYAQMRVEGYHPDGTTLPQAERVDLAFFGQYKTRKPSIKKSKSPAKPRQS